MKNYLLMSIICAMVITSCSNANDTSISTTSEAEIQNGQEVIQASDSTANNKNENQSLDIVLSFGEKANAGNYTLVLNKLVVGEKEFSSGDGQLRIELVYEVENTSSEDLQINPYSFEGYADDYLVRENQYLKPLEANTGLEYFTGNIAPGKKLKGIIEFFVPEDFLVFESRYTDYSGNHITYKVTREQFDISN